MLVCRSRRAPLAAWVCGWGLGLLCGSGVSAWMCGSGRCVRGRGYSAAGGWCGRWVCGEAVKGVAGVGLCGCVRGILSVGMAVAAVLCRRGRGGSGLACGRPGAGVVWRAGQGGRGCRTTRVYPRHTVGRGGVAAVPRRRGRGGSGLVRGRPGGWPDARRRSGPNRASKRQPLPGTYKLWKGYLILSLFVENSDVLTRPNFIWSIF